MGVHRLAGDEEPHDLAGALEDQVDAIVAHHSLDWVGALAPASETVRRLIAAAALDLERVVHDPPAHLSAPHLGHRGLEREVCVAPVGHKRSEIAYRPHRKNPARHIPDLLCEAIVLPDRLAPLD